MSDTSDALIFYYPGISSFRSDGTLIMRTSGYEGDIHWSGQHSVAPGDSDYELWCWMRENFRAASAGASQACTLADLTFAREEFSRQRSTQTKNT